MAGSRVVAVSGQGVRGSGYLIGPRLVLTSAHVVGGAGSPVGVSRVGVVREWSGVVVWCGTPAGRDDAALVEVTDTDWDAGPVALVRWGRLVTDVAGARGEAWGFPQVVQRPGRGLESWQASGRINPGDRVVGDRYVLRMDGPLPEAPEDGDQSPWAGLSGAGLVCGDLLAGVVAVDPVGWGHAAVEAVPAYVLVRDAGFCGVLAAHGLSVPVLEAVEWQELADRGEVDGPGGVATPTGLLRARRQVVPFRHREDVLADLMGWVGRPGFGVWLVHGPGGAGKTRLAAHLADQLGRERWAVVWLRAPKEGVALDLSVVASAAVPALVVVDYAEARGGQLEALWEACARYQGGLGLKVLLLARTAGDWWDAVCEGSAVAEGLLEGAGATGLGPLEPDHVARMEAYREAVAAFAGALPTVPGRGEVEWAQVAARVRAPVGVGGALTLHMTALADLLDAATVPSAPDQGGGFDGGPGVDVERRLLGHERRYWTAAARSAGLDLGPQTLADVMAAAVLVGVADRMEADGLLQRIPGVADQPRDRRDRVLAWLCVLYPSMGGRMWEGLGPDRLAERFAGDQLLRDNGQLADHLAAGATTGQAEQMLTVYTRAAAHPVFTGQLGAQVTALCLRHRPVLVPAIVPVATRVEAPGPLLDALAAVVQDRDTPADALRTLADALPPTSQVLAGWACDLASRLVEHDRHAADEDPDAFLPDLAGSLNNLSVRFGALGRREEGLAAVQEAIAIRRALAEARPDAFLPNLAGSLNNLSVRFGELGRREEGLAAIQEAIETYRALAEARPDAFLPNLATSLNNLSVDLGELGRREEGLAAIQEAIAIRRALAEARPDAFLPDLAGSLNNLSVRFGALGRREEGLAAIQEAVETYRALAEARPDAFLPDLAMSLNNLSVQFGELGRREEGLAAVQEAIAIRRALAEARPDAFLPDLAGSLNNLSVRFGELGRREEGLAAIQEAVETYRALAEARPDAFLPNLATSLNNLSVDLGELGRREEGLAAVQEAIETYRALAEARPDAFLPNLATSLNNLSIRFGALGRREEGLAAIQEAVETYRALAEARPDAFLPNLATSLNNLSNRFGELGRREEGLAAVQEAIAIRRALAEARPDAFLPDLAGSLNNLSVRFGELGRREEGLAAIQEAVETYRALAEARPDAFLPDLAMSLNNLSVQFGALGRREEGLAAVQEAIAIRRALAEARPDAFLPDLAGSLNNLSVRFGELGRREEGLAAIQEAVETYRALAEARPQIYQDDLQRSLRVLAILEERA